MNKILFYFILFTSIISIPIFAFGVLNIAVSQKYEVEFPNDCISLTSGKNLCTQMNIFVGLFFISILVPILLLVYKKKIIKNNKPNI